MSVMFRMAFASLLLLGPSMLAADANQDIRAALDYFAQMWNEDDFDALAGYYHPDFVLITPQGPVDQKQRMDDLRVILGDEKDQGELTYSQVTVKDLGDGYAVAYGQVILEFEDGSSIRNWFTTTYQKTPFGWKALLSYN